MELRLAGDCSVQIEDPSTLPRKMSYDVLNLCNVEIYLILHFPFSHTCMFFCPQQEVVGIIVHLPLFSTSLSIPSPPSNH